MSGVMQYPQYAAMSFWDVRYARETRSYTEWLQSYETLRSILRKLLQPDSEILVVGCGNSRLSECLHDDGFPFISNIDTSSVVISQMRERYKESGRDDMDFEVMDALDLKFPANVFDAVIDKCTLDTILCGENALERAKTIVKEAFRTLRDGGTYVVVSFSSPERRLPYLSSAQWQKIEYTMLPAENSSANGEVHYVYQCTKP